MTIAETDGTATMSIRSEFGSEGMERMIEMRMEQGMVEALGQIDALLVGETACARSSSTPSSASTG